MTTEIIETTTVETLHATSLQPQPKSKPEPQKRKAYIGGKVSGLPFDQSLKNLQRKQKSCVL